MPFLVDFRYSSYLSYSRLVSHYNPFQTQFIQIKIYFALYLVIVHAGINFSPQRVEQSAKPFILGIGSHLPHAACSEDRCACLSFITMLANDTVSQPLHRSNSCSLRKHTSGSIGNFSGTFWSIFFLRISHTSLLVMNQMARELSSIATHPDYFCEIWIINKSKMKSRSDTKRSIS